MSQHGAKRRVLAGLAIAGSGVFTLAIFVMLIAEKGWRVGVGALAIVCITSALAIAGQAAMASGAGPAPPHPAATASYSDHWGWHRVNDVRKPWVWPLVATLAALGLALGGVWFAAN